MNIKPQLVYYKTLQFSEDVLAYLTKYFEVTSLPDPSYDNPDILANTVVALAPMGFSFNKTKIDSCPQLRIIGSPTTGELHIDTNYAKGKDISLCSLKNQQKFLATITSTAELAWGLILSVVRRIPFAFDAVCEGRWIGREIAAKTPKMLSQMTLGIVGLGRLGTLVAGYGKVFGMTVYYFDPYITDDRFIKCEDILDLARASEIVSVHVHLSEETENLIDDKFIRVMPEGGYVINTARGGIVNEGDLLEALQSGQLAGAGLDMLSGEHLPGFKDEVKDHPLLTYAKSHDNLIITPKIGGCTVDAWEKTQMRLAEMIVKKIGELGAV